VHEFKVWAPRPERVDVVLAGRRLPMTRQDDGWWTVTDASAGPGTDYAFSLNEGQPRADPRSKFQPLGTKGPSRLVDHGSFAWTSGWRGQPLADSVIYECHVGTFSPAGTFTGAIDGLEHLVSLGVDAVELMPVAEFPGHRGWGYDGVNLFAPHHSYGTPDDLKRLVDAAHGLGLAIILDVVWNHLGPSDNYLAEFGPYFTTRYRTPWGEAVNFDDDYSDEVRRFVIDNATMWLRDYRFDGLRIDAVHAIYDTSATSVLAQLADEVKALAAHVGRPLYLIAECDQNDPRIVSPPAAGGHGLDSCWADDWHHAVHANLTGEHSGWYGDYVSLPRLAKALRQAWVYDGEYSAFRRRSYGRSPAGLSGSQFVVCTQNHDQIGNRALGDRTSVMLSPARLKIAAALLLTAPFTPMIFQGEEWGASTPFPYFTDHEDQALAQAIRDGREAEFAAFGWDQADVPDPQSPSTFEQAKLDWAELAKPAHAELLTWYRDLIKLRAELPELTDPRLDRVTTTCDESSGRLTVRRGEILIAVNLGTADWIVPEATDPLAASDPRIKPVPGGLLLPPDTAALARPRPDTGARPSLGNL
jgi:maltooligosyltrehalose trehalohydrolase